MGHAIAEHDGANRVGQLGHRQRRDVRSDAHAEITAKVARYFRRQCEAQQQDQGERDFTRGLCRYKSSLLGVLDTFPRGLRNSRPSA